MRMLVSSAIVCGAVAVIFAETRTLTFDDGVAGQPPKGFAFGLTKKEGAPGRWLIQQEGDAKYLAQLEADATRRR